MSLLGPNLEAFIAVVKYQTVHGAASAIHITQTAVTQRIRALEAKLDTTLFIRTRRGMLLTSEGEALLRYCYAVRDLEGEALAKIKGAATQTEIRVSITGPSSLMHSRIIPQCLTVMEKFPKLLMTFDITDSEDRFKLLKSGTAHFAIVEPQYVAREMESKTLNSEEYVLVCTARWKNRRLLDIIHKERIVDFDPSDQITFNYLKHFKIFEKAQLERHFANRTESLALMVAQGLGYGVLTKEFSKSYLDQRQLILLNSGKIYQHKYSLAWYPRPEPPKYFKAIINALN